MLVAGVMLVADSSPNLVYLESDSALPRNTQGSNA